jgi:Aerotolerance regulator N-terminal/von Willebrand factor type A domain
MPFLFSNPLAEWLLPAIALPILFHLFFRLRRQVREFPSLMFFLRIDPRLSAKRKIHEWLILLLRCLFIALLILALARPLLGLKGSNENVARLVLIDNSGSMSASTAGGISKLTLAQRATQKLLDASHPGDAMAVQVMIPDPTATLPRGFDTTPALLRDAMGKLTPADAAASVPKAIRAALATLDTAKTPQRELHIITDLQRENWSRGELGADAQSPNCRIIIHRIESAPLAAGSVSIELQQVPARAIPAGRVTPVRVKLQNNGPVAAHVRLNSTDDSGKNFSQNFDVAAKAVVPATLTFSFPSAGFHWAQIWVEGDLALMASRASLGFFCTDVRKALFVGSKEDFGALPYAISPGGNSDLSGIDAVFSQPDQLVSHLADKPLAVILSWDNFPQDGATSDALQDYVRQGGTLILVPAPNAGVTVSRAAPAWLDANAGALQTTKEPEPLVLLRETDPLWQDLRGADGLPKLGLLRAFQYRPVKTGDGWQALVTSSNGATLLARRTWEHGQVYASGLAFTPKWSSFPLRASFVVLVQNAVFGNLAEQIPVQNLVAGEEFHFDLPDANAVLKSLAGSALDWQGMPRDFAGLPRAGVYEISQRDHANWVATSANADEADPTYLPLGPVPLLRNLPHDVVPLGREDDLTRVDVSRAGSTSLYRWLLLAALLVLLAETWLANVRSSDLGRKLSLKPGAPPEKPASKQPGELTRV